MSRKLGRVALILMNAVLLLIVAYVALAQVKWTVTGQVVDAETGKSIQGAAVAIDWWEAAFGPPGLAGTDDLGVGEDTSDAQGRFRVLKYMDYGLFGREFRMAVYKEGYVFWSSSKIFPGYKKRIDFSPTNGMIIRLEPFKEQYSKEDHAMFVSNMGPTANAPLFSKAIKSEEDLAGEVVRKNRGKQHEKNALLGTHNICWNYRSHCGF